MRKSVHLMGLTALDDSTYLLKITSTEHFPSRKEIVQWCKNLGMSISASDIHIRNDVIRVKSINGAVNFKPAAGLMKALRDTSTECLFAEVGDTTIYVNGGLHAMGTIKAMGDGKAVIVNTDSGELCSCALTALLEVKGVKVDEASGVNPELILKKTLGL